MEDMTLGHGGRLHPFGHRGDQVGGLCAGRADQGVHIAGEGVGKGVGDRLTLGQTFPASGPEWPWS
eukprot:13870310-Heterocapsa_arctica.AAC.1